MDIKTTIFFIILIGTNIITEINTFTDNELGFYSTKFGAKIYEALLSKYYNQNILVSPVSLQFILGTLQLGAEGITADELSNVLETPLDKDTLTKYLHQLQQSLTRKDLNINSKEPNITIANAIYVRPDVRVHEKLYDIATKILNVDIRSLENKASKDHIVTQINNWISQQTHNQLNNVLQDDDVTIDTVMLLLNTLHFKGKWRDSGFNISDTIDELFHKNLNSSVPVPMMKTTGYFFIGRYIPLNITYLELPYSGKNNDEDGDYVLAIYLPDSIQFGKQLIKDNIKNLLLNIPEIHEEQVDVRIPRFRMNLNSHLKEILENLGLKHAFSNAHFNSLTVDKKSVSVTDVIHNTALNVNEEGSEASAVTVIGIDDRIFSQPIPFVANKPFLFVLKQKSTNIPLFIGEYNTPKNNDL